MIDYGDEATKLYDIRKVRDYTVCLKKTEIPREMVAISFLKCGITNSLDGSEDDFIFDTSSDDESIVADDSLVTELFNDSESEADFEGF